MSRQNNDELTFEERCEYLIQRVNDNPKRFSKIVSKFRNLEPTLNNRSKMTKRILKQIIDIKLPFNTERDCGFVTYQLTDRLWNDLHPENEKEPIVTIGNKKQVIKDDNNEDIEQ